MIPTAAALDSLRTIGDPPADEVICQLFQRKLVENANSLFKLLTENNHMPDKSHPAAALLNDFLQYTELLPEFADQRLLDRGAAFFQDHGPQILTILGAYSLPLDYAANKGVQVLVRTGRMNGSLNRRIVETAQMLTDMLQPGGFLPGGRSIRVIQKVRLIHAAVRYLIRCHDPTWRDEYGTPINQEDMAGTLLSFSYAVIDGLQRLGLNPAAADAEAYCHCFRVAGQLLGIQAPLLPSSLDAAKELAHLIRGRQIVGSSEAGREMTAALLRLMDEAYPWPLKGTGPALMRFLLGEQIADWLAVPKTAWTAKELLHIQQRFYVRAEAAANASSLVCALRHTLSHWYLTHLQMIDRGPGRGQLQIPEQLRSAWQTVGVEKSAGGSNSQPRPEPSALLTDLPRPVPLRSIVHPVERNHRITQSYHELSEAMGKLLGEPRVADWCTFAKFASRQAGEHIRETSVTAGRLLNALMDSSVPGKLQRIAEDIITLPARLAMARQLLTLCLARSARDCELHDVKHSQRPRLLTALSDFRAAAARLNRAFFLGNLRVYENIAPAYCTYLRAARMAGDGIPAEIPEFEPEIDPAGYLRRGLQCYRAAQLAFGRGSLAERDQQVHNGSLWLGLHEQGCVLQPLFDEVRDELRALSQNIYVEDPRTVTHMLPEGGDWGDLYQRMGIDPARAQPQPWTELPPLRTDAKFAGTIAAYFQDGLHSDLLMQTRPTAIHPMGKGPGDVLLDEERSLA